MKRFLLLLCLLGLIFTSPGLALAEEKGEETDIVQLEDVVVTATKTPHTLKDVPVETVVITRKDIERTNAQNALDILKIIPGINTSVHDDVFGTYTWRANLRGLDLIRFL
ncbi:MAG: TonB-dependent receptor plug domain-containing protein [Deltaproteobacteria bacterium]|nr:TonB-dependent receptor plug domain-containing protein [Deltaproteobacteria bacterium]